MTDRHAFPFLFQWKEGDRHFRHKTTGMTLREHFASLAMQAFIPIVNEAGVSPDEYPAIAAKLAVMAADALLKALEEK